jgi:hypothetical protein
MPDQNASELIPSDRRKLLRNVGLGTVFAAASGFGLFSPERAQAARPRPTPIF